MTRCITLQTLGLNENGVGDAGAASLASALEKNATLQTLNLGGYETLCNLSLKEAPVMGDVGAALLASALEKNATLRTLDLGANGVGDAGAASLASARERNNTLQELKFDSTFDRS